MTTPNEDLEAISKDAARLTPWWAGRTRVWLLGMAADFRGRGLVDLAGRFEAAAECMVEPGEVTDG